MASVKRAGWWAVLAGLFLVSVLVRRPVFNKDFTFSWEWLAAHTLLTNQLWNETPAAVHHFNLLYTFGRPADKFIDDLWQSGVADPAGNLYYVSMPHLAFLTPRIFFVLTQLKPTIANLQVFDLTVQLIACGLLFLLARRVTNGLAGSQLAAVAAFTVLLFAPTALFFYQNAVVGTVMVIPYTVVVLIGVLALLQDEPVHASRRLAWVTLFVGLLLGCLTDWQAYFTAFATFVVSIVVALRRPGRRATAVRVAALASVCVGLAVVITMAQDSRINGLQPFLHTIFGRLKVRAGASEKGLGLTTVAYYRNMARFYVAYLPFVAMSGGLLGVAWKRQNQTVRRMWNRASMVLAISVLAVLLDHVVLANHTSEQSFTTLNSLVPIGLLAAVSVAAFLETSVLKRRDGMVVCAALVMCIVLSVGEYYFAYWNRPHPFRSAAETMAAAAQPDDVVFATGSGFAMPNDYIIPQMLFYLRRNVLVVGSEDEARAWLKAHSFQRGVLATVTKDYRVVGVQVITK